MNAPVPPCGWITVELLFGGFSANSPAATSPFRKYNTFIEIDGRTEERPGGAYHAFTVTPGWHLVRVYFKVRPSLISTETGARQQQVLVYPGYTQRLRYAGGLFWPLTGATLEILPPA
jgi:hypothetical protein